MSFMTDVYHKPPANPAKEAAITDRMIFFGGRLDLREDTDDHDLGGVCLSYEFDDIEGATEAADLLREFGEDFEGPYEMRPDWTEGREPASVPFQPPADFAFEPELRGDPPRALPDAFRQSWYANERRTKVRILFVLGLFSLGMALLPIMELWTDILPPLKLLFWGGVALVVGATLLNVGTTSGTARRYDYVRRGVPIIARVRSFHLGPHASEWYRVQFDAIDPELAEREKEEWQAAHKKPAAAAAAVDDEEHDAPGVAAERAPVNFGLVSIEGLSETIPAGLMGKVSLTYRVGDYVTAVYFTGQLK